MVALASGASAATFSITLSPSKVNKNSTLTVSASGFTAESSAPTSAELQVQPGFKTSVKSVAKLCTAGGSSCPARSKIGSGAAQLSGSLLGVSVSDTVSFTLYLGKPDQRGDIASVEIVGSDTRFHQNLTGSGRLLKDSAGGLVLLFDHFPSISGLPSGVSITLNSLSFTVGAKRTVKRHHKRVTYSLITNPSSCTGSWDGSGTVTFPSGPASQAFSTPCTG